MQSFKFAILEFDQLLTNNVKARDPVGSIISLYSFVKNWNFSASEGEEFYSCMSQQSYTGCEEDAATGATMCYCEDDGTGKLLNGWDL